MAFPGSAPLKAIAAPISIKIKAADKENTTERHPTLSISAVGDTGAEFFDLRPLLIFLPFDFFTLVIFCLPYTRLLYHCIRERDDK
jgi:hypothetical protein